eukprot:819454-Pelagomonas_calceolata.AAC.1
MALGVLLALLAVKWVSCDCITVQPLLQVRCPGGKHISIKQIGKKTPHILGKSAWHAVRRQSQIQGEEVITWEGSLIFPRYTTISGMDKQHP